jgi:hypothetical protein
MEEELVTYIEQKRKCGYSVNSAVTVTVTVEHLSGLPAAREGELCPKSKQRITKYQEPPPWGGGGILLQLFWQEV